jgi:hypothetical protein
MSISIHILIFKCAVAKKKKRKRMIRQMLNWKRNVVLAYNGLRLGEGCLTDVIFSRKTFWQLLPNRCYVLGGLSALNLIYKRNGKHCN